MGFKYFNNTQVGNYAELFFNSPWVFSDGASNEIRNNIIWRLDTLTTNLIMGNVPASANLVVDYNLWSERPADVDARGAHDPAYSLPFLCKTTGWRAVNLNSLSPSDFRLRFNSPAIGKGANLGPSFNVDYFGGQRLSELAWDNGAHEYPEFAVPVLAGGRMNLKWAGSGRLEWASELQGPWTALAPAPSSPYSEPLNSGTNRFYRLNATP